MVVINIQFMITFRKNKSLTFDIFLGLVQPLSYIAIHVKMAIKVVLKARNRANIG